MENWRPDGKRAPMTGAGSGIGRAIATFFADAESDVIVFDLNGTSAQETAAAISVAVPRQNSIRVQYRLRLRRAVELGNGLVGQ